MTDYETIKQELLPTISDVIVGIENEIKMIKDSGGSLPEESLRDILDDIPLLDESENELKWGKEAIRKIAKGYKDNLVTDVSVPKEEEQDYLVGSMLGRIRNFMLNNVFNTELFELQSLHNGTLRKSFLEKYNNREKLMYLDDKNADLFSLLNYFRVDGGAAGKYFLNEQIYEYVEKLKQLYEILSSEPIQLVEPTEENIVYHLRKVLSDGKKWTGDIENDFMSLDKLENLYDIDSITQDDLDEIYESVTPLGERDKNDHDPALHGPIYKRFILDTYEDEEDTTRATLLHEMKNGVPWLYYNNALNSTYPLARYNRLVALIPKTDNLYLNDIPEELRKLLIPINPPGTGSILDEDEWVLDPINPRNIKILLELLSEKTTDPVKKAEIANAQDFIEDNPIEEADENDFGDYEANRMEFVSNIVNFYDQIESKLPTILPTPAKPEDKEEKKSDDTTTLYIILGSVFGGLLLIGLLVWFFTRKDN